MNPVLLNVSIAGCHPFPALMHNGRVLALAWWNVDELREIESVEQLVKRWQRVGPALRAVSESPDTTALIAAHGAALDACRVHAPVVPRQVYCTIGNYRAQVIESAIDAEDGPSGPKAAARRAISYLSRHTRLEPGDLLCTGSPAGFGSHHRRFLSAGDIVEAGVDGLGSQRVLCVGEGLPLH